MNRRYIFITIIALFVVGVIAFNTYLFLEKNNYDEGLLIVQNENVKRQHCSENICFENLQVTLEKSANFVCLAGDIKNQTSVKYEGKVEIIFETEKGRSIIKTKVSLDSFETKHFETHNNDLKLLKPVDYTIREVN